MVSNRNVPQLRIHANATKLAIARMKYVTMSCAVSLEPTPVNGKTLALAGPATGAPLPEAMPTPGTAAGAMAGATGETPAKDWNGRLALELVVAAAMGGGVPATKPTAEFEVMKATCGTATAVLRMDVVMQVAWTRPSLI